MLGQVVRDGMQVSLLDSGDKSNRRLPMLGQVVRDGDAGKSGFRLTEKQKTINEKGINRGWGAKSSTFR
jgi:hypothetical protein